MHGAVGTYPIAKLGIRKFGDLPVDQLSVVERSVRRLLNLP